MKKILLVAMLATIGATGAMAKHTAKYTGHSFMEQHGKMCKYMTKHGDTYWFSFRAGICAESVMV